MGTWDYFHCHLRNKVHYHIAMPLKRAAAARRPIEALKRVDAPRSVAKSRDIGGEAGRDAEKQRPTSERRSVYA